MPSLTPTLFLVKDALVQAAVHDLPDALSEQPAMLQALKSGSGHLANALMHGKGTASGSASARAALARAASHRLFIASRLQFLVEQLLAILYVHLRLGEGNRRHGGAASHAIAALQPSRGLERLGSPKDFDQLRRLVEPAIAALEQLLAVKAIPDDSSALEMLVRRTKECLLDI